MATQILGMLSLGHHWGSIFFIMEKAPLLLPSVDRKWLPSALLLVLSTVASACKEVVYVPTYSNLPEDTGRSLPDDEPEAPDEDEPSSADSGAPDFPLSAEECGETFDPVDMTIFDPSFSLYAPLSDFSLNPILTVRYEDFYGRVLPAEGFYPLVRLVYKNHGEAFNTQYCYPLDVAVVEGFAFVTSYDLTCGLDTSDWEYGKAFAYVLMADEAAPCESRPFGAAGDWVFENGSFVEDPCFVGIDTCH